MIKILLVLIASLLLSGCSLSEPDKTKRLLEQEGYTNIETIGYAWFSCGQDDFFATGFIAEKNGHHIEGTVCSGLIFKNSTIRLK